MIVITCHVTLCLILQVTSKPFLNQTSAHQSYGQVLLDFVVTDHRQPQSQTKKKKSISAPLGSKQDRVRVINDWNY